jgi:hypothetical protein
MNEITTFRLSKSEEGDLHPFLTAEGAFLGDRTPLLECEFGGRSHRRWRPRPQAELERLLAVGYGEPVHLGTRMGAIEAAAKALNAGDKTRAAIALLHARLPPLPSRDAAQRMAKADLLSKTFNPNELRIPKGSPGGGEWTTDGDLDAFLEETGYSPDIRAKLRQLYRFLKEHPGALRRLRGTIVGLALEQALPLGLSLLDPPKSLSELQTKRPPCGFDTEAQLLNYLGPAPPGYEWHHIIEQTQTDPYLNSPEGQRAWIQRTDNMVLVPTVRHWLISAEMNSKEEEGGARLRDIVRQLPPQQQREIGLDLLRKHGVLE